MTIADAAYDLAHRYQQARLDGRTHDALTLADALAALIRADADEPVLVQRNNGFHCSHPDCDKPSHVWTAQSLPGGYVEACLAHRHGLVRDTARMMGTTYTEGATEGTNPNGYRR
jgi:hypothetical protein